MRRALLLLAVVVVLVVSACGGDDATLEGTLWTLDSIDVGDEQTGVLADTTPTITFQGSTVSGSDGCNTFTGSVTIGPDDDIAFGPLAGTLMACPDPVMEQADAIQGILGEAERYEVSGDELVIFSTTDSLVYTSG